MKKINQLSQVKDADACVTEYEELLRGIKKIENVVAAKELTDRVIVYKQEMYKKLQQKQLEIQGQLAVLSEHLKEVEQTIHNLERKRFSYQPAVELLQSKIEQEFFTNWKNSRTQNIV